GVMPIAVGSTAMRAATVVLLANTAPVAFGAIAIPLITAGSLTGIPYRHLGGSNGHQAPFLAAVVPLLLVPLADRRHGVRQLPPPALVVGLVFAISQYLSSNFISVELTDIIASLAGLGAAVLMLRVWTPVGGADALANMRRERESEQADAPRDGTGA